jgi:hypothetical protein
MLFELSTNGQYLQHVIEAVLSSLAASRPVAADGWREANDVKNGYIPCISRQMLLGLHIQAYTYI